jgi:hypothetical protein
VVAARDKVLAAAARDRALHHADLAAVVEVEVARMAEDEATALLAAEAAARRVH